MSGRRLARVGVAVLLGAAGAVLPALPAAAECDPGWERLTGFCTRCQAEAWTYHTADAAALDLLPDIAWRCAS